MATEFSPISPNKYVCNVCTISCNRKTEWERHLQTNKHKINKNGENSNILATTVSPFVCECGKKYTDRTGLWRHKKKCSFENSHDNHIIEPKNNDLMTYLMNENKELKCMIMEVCKNNSITNNNTINTNSNNKTFNLQVFLNEDCKDAMNISDFMSSIQLQLEELVSVGKLGFVEGISNIIIKNLKALDIRKRPLHCTDLKRETVYIKDNGVWVKDDEDNTKIRKVIKNVAFRNSKNTRLFKDKYPDCVRSESRLSDTYSIIIIEAMGGGSKTDPKESEDKILRRILKELTIDKSKYLS